MVAVAVSAAELAASTVEWVAVSAAVALSAQAPAVGSARSTADLIDSTVDSLLGADFSSVPDFIPGVTRLTTPQGGVTATRTTLTLILAIRTRPRITITALPPRLRL